MKYKPEKKLKVYSEEQIIKIKNLFPSKTIQETTSFFRNRFLPTKKELNIAIANDLKHNKALQIPGPNTKRSFQSFKSNEVTVIILARSPI